VFSIGAARSEQNFMNRPPLPSHKASAPFLRAHSKSLLVMGGGDIRTEQELLGQKDIRMTMGYAHLALDPPEDAVGILDGHYLDTKGSEQENQDAAFQA
jgi:hypothetical protein